MTEIFKTLNDSNPVFMKDIFHYCQNKSHKKQKNIAKKLDLIETECLAKNPAFITLKDHKENFQASLPCHFVNPSKSGLRKVSKVKLEKINPALIKHLDVN